MSEIKESKTYIVQSIHGTQISVSNPALGVAVNAGNEPQVMELNAEQVAYLKIQHRNSLTVVEAKIYAEKQATLVKIKHDAIVEANKSVEEIKEEIPKISSSEKPRTAIDVINSMESVDVIIAYVNGEERVTVKQAAENKIEAINKSIELATSSEKEETTSPEGKNEIHPDNLL